MKKRFLVLLSLGFLFLACDDDKQLNAFLQNSDLRLQVGKTVHFSYNPLTCQVSFSRTKKEFRCQTDNTSDYYSAVFNMIPSNLGETVVASIEWTTPKDILHKNNITLEVVKLEGDVVYLWSYADHTGLSIKILE